MRYLRLDQKVVFEHTLDTFDSNKIHNFEEFNSKANAVLVGYQWDHFFQINNPFLPSAFTPRHRDNIEYLVDSVIDSTGRQQDFSTVFERIKGSDPGVPSVLPFDRLEKNWIGMIFCDRLRELLGLGFDPISAHGSNVAIRVDIPKRTISRVSVPYFLGGSFK